MAPKRPNPLQDPPAASTSEEEEEENSTEGEEEDEDGVSSEEEEDEEEPQAHNQKPSASQPQAQSQPKKSALKKPDSSANQDAESEESESGSDDESDSDSASDLPNNAALEHNVKPIASKPMEETPTKTSKPRSKPSTAVTTAASKSTVAKRGNETDRDPKNAKRRKKKELEGNDGVGEKSEDTKKQLFQRLWSEDDEIAVLKGIIDFTEKRGVDPTKDMAAFYDFIKKSLHVDVSLTQMKDKVWRLKKKFENHVKGKKGEDKSFSRPHDQKTFDLSKKIWGSERPSRAMDSSVQSNGKTKKSGNGGNNNQRGNNSKLAALKAELGVGDGEDRMEVETEQKKESSLDMVVGAAGMEDFVVKKGLDMVEGSKRAELVKRWRKLHVEELELFLQRNELIRDQAKLMLEAYKAEED